MREKWMRLSPPAPYSKDTTTACGKYFCRCAAARVQILDQISVHYAVSDVTERRTLCQLTLIADPKAPKFGACCAWPLHFTPPPLAHATRPGRVRWTSTFPRCLINQNPAWETYTIWAPTTKTTAAIIISEIFDNKHAQRDRRTWWNWNSLELCCSNKL
jgi:hypothetical protein